jgi:hypothetical protein
MLEIDADWVKWFFFGFFTGYLVSAVLILMAWSYARSRLENLEKKLDSGFRRNDERVDSGSGAGMTGEG